MVLCFSPKELWANLSDFEVEINNSIVHLPHLRIASYLWKTSVDIQYIYVQSIYFSKEHILHLALNCSLEIE